MKFHFAGLIATAATLAAGIASAQYNPGTPDDGYLPTRTVRCLSVQGRRAFCPVSYVTRARVARQLSRYRCVQGRNWNYSNRGIWVSKGCRADFTVTRRNPNANRVVRDDHYVDSTGRLIHCESTASGRTYCGDGHSRYSMTGNRDPDCIEGRTWGIDQRGLWVSGDCDASFNRNPYDQNGDDDRYGDHDHDAYDHESIPGNTEVEHTHHVDSTGQVVHCQSTADGRTYCGDHDSRYIISGTRDPDCIEGVTYGYDDRGTWVSGECDAQFTLDPNQDRHY